MDIRIIKSPSPGALNIILRRKGSGAAAMPPCMDAIGLIQGKMIEMVVAADIAEKAVGVTVEEVKGSCPQNMILLAVFGDTAAVESALKEIHDKLEEGKKYGSSKVD